MTNDHDVEQTLLATTYLVKEHERMDWQMAGYMD